jgi:hypothetical protein
MTQALAHLRTSRDDGSSLAIDALSRACGWLQSAIKAPILRHTFGAMHDHEMFAWKCNDLRR